MKRTPLMHRTLPWRAVARAFGAAIAVAVLIGLVAACGGSPSAAGASTTTARATHPPSALAFSRCMRSHGVPNYPDPNSSGGLPKKSAEQLGVSQSRFQSATQDCRHLLPNGGTPTQAEIQQVRVKSLEFSQCMRRHGVNLPDPDSSGRIPDPASVGIDQGSPQFQAANQACARVRPPYMPSNAQYNAYARSNGS
jgi:hypothetical protein